MSIYMSYCAECREKLEKVRAMTEISRQHYGYCQGCFSHKAVKQFEIGGTWEQLDRIRRKSKSRGPRAGEREKANG